AAGITYSIDGVTYTNTTGVFTGIAPGTYNVTYNNGTCISAAAPVTINPAPTAPAAPTAVATSPATCTDLTGSITVTVPAPAAGITYSINGVTYTNTTGVFTGIAPGTYNVTYNNGTCISGAAQVTINTAPTAPAASTAVATSPANCTDPTGTITVTVPAPAAVITYSIDGVTYTNTTGVFTGVAPGTYNVTVQNAAGCISAVSQVTVDPQPAALVPAVSMLASSTSICTAGSITFTAIPVNGGSAPAYQWQINGANVAGQTSATFTTAALANGNNVTVILTSNDPCANPATATSAPVTITNTTVAPSVTIDASATDICPGASVTFTATPVNGGPAPAYQWQINGVAVPGATAATFTSTTLNNNDIVTVIMTSNDPCATPANRT